MNSKKLLIEKLIVFLSLLLVVTVSVFLFSVTDKGYAFELKEQLKESYNINESIYLPHGSFEVDGKIIDADSQICYPNGNSYSKTYCTLDVAGKYTVKYTANVSGELLEEVRSFVVVNTLYTISGNGSATFSEELGGLDVQLSAGSSFIYNNLIDISDFTADDSIVSFYVNAPGVQMRDFETLYVTLTDAYDSANQIHFRAYAADNFPSLSYSRVLSYFSCAVGAKNYFVGISHDSGNISKGDRYGYWSQFSFSNQGQKGTGSDDQATFSLDYEKKNMYVSTSFAGKAKVSELSNPAYYSAPWAGFTNGLCYLSVSADNYINASANIVITDIAGDDLTAVSLEDNVKPEIVIDYKGFDNMPFGIKGKSYKLFDAEVIDNLDVNAKLNIDVYYNYYTSKRENINVIDGAFVPEKSGVYTVIYSTTDSYGNYCEKFAEIVVKEQSSVLPLEVAVDQPFGEVTAGDSVTVENSFEIKSREEELGNVTVSVYVENGEGKTPLYSGNVDDDFSVSYRAFNLGKNSVVYEFSDYVRTVTVRKDFNVEKPSKNQFLQTESEVELPRYFVCNTEYLLPDVEIVSYTQSGEKNIKKADITVVEDGAMKTVENNVYKVGSSCDSVTVRYVDKDNAENYIQKEIEVVSLYDNKTLKLEKLFRSEQAVITSGSNCIAVESDSDSVINCVQELLANNFSFVFDVNPEKNGFNEVLVTISDSRVKDLSLTVSFVKSSGETKVYLNKEYAGASYSVSADFYKSKNVNYQLSYNEDAKTVTVENSTIELKKYLNGNAFNGFPSKTVVLTVEMIGVEDTSELRLMKLNGQPLSNVKTDSIAPSLFLSSSDAFSYDLNAEYQTPVAKAFDVVCGKSDATVSVRKIGGGYLKDKSGKEIKDLDASESYSLTLAEYGEYSVQITARDGNGQTFRQAIMVSVLDRVNPEITLNGNLNDSYKNGSEAVIPKITVTDNISEDISGFVVVKAPNGKLNIVSGEKYKFEQTGEYTFMFIAYDDAGNMAKTEKTVKVG